MRWLAAMFLVGGCDLIYDLKEPPPPPLLPPGCSPTSMITDDFEGPALADKWLEVKPSGTILQTGGQLVFDVTGDAFVATRPFLELRENAVSVSVFIPGTVPEPGGDVSLELMTQEPSRNTLVMSVQGDQLVAGKIEEEDGVPRFKDVGKVPYAQLDETLRYWQIRQQGTTTLWETSPDGITFTTLFEDENLDWVGFMQALLSVHVESGNTIAQFDNFNGGGVPRGQACPADALRDDFTGDVIGEQWRITAERCVFDLVDGGVQASFVGVSAGELRTCILDANTFYDLRNHPIAVEVTDIETIQGPTERVLFVVRTLDGLEGAFEQKDGLLVASADGFVFEQKTYDEVEHRWWRFNAVDGELLWEVSADGNNFVLFADTSMSPLGPLDIVSLLIGFQGQNIEPATVRFEGVNTR